ncbi:MAG TPA: hypothetical protein VK533_00045 [Sphingomonas sp.]|uniref:hypothetical protein n=1 Tax=Sphingomonas sp. TaxID=28214 RepID=UPI002B6F41AD|nr:hypothetical protein [Sphingomonas sp.]HMI17907.1 hypothetical protein [Sphingomonas sp.]
MQRKILPTALVMMALIQSVGIGGCSKKVPEDDTFAPVYAYTKCTADARVGLDAARVSPQQAGRIVDRCDAELRTAAQALASRDLFDGSVHANGAKSDPRRNLAYERQLLRDMALCSTSSEAEEKLCHTID